MQENKEQVIAIFDKPETCKTCPFSITLKEHISWCKLSKDIVVTNKKFNENEDCQLIDHDEYHESLDIENYK